MKKKLSLLMAIVMIVTTIMTALPVITIPVIAAGDTFSVAADQSESGTAGTYATLAAAIDAVKEGGTIKMEADYAASENVQAKTKSWTLDGNNKKWTNTGDFCVRVGATGTTGKTITFKNITFDVGATSGKRLLQVGDGCSVNLVLDAGTKFTQTGTGTAAMGIMKGNNATVTVDGAVFELPSAPAIVTWANGAHHVVLNGGTLSYGTYKTTSGANITGAIVENTGWGAPSVGSTVTGTGNMKIYTGAGSTRDMNIADINVTNAKVSVAGHGVTVYETTETVVGGETVYGIGNVYVHSDGTEVENGTYAAAVELAKIATKDVTIKLHENITVNKQMESSNGNDIVVDGSNGNGGKYTLTNNAGNTFRMNGIGDLIFKDISLKNTSGSSCFFQARSWYITFKFINCDVYGKPGDYVINLMARDQSVTAAMTEKINAYNTANGTNHAAIVNLEIKNSNMQAVDKALICLGNGTAGRCFNVDIEGSTLQSNVEVIQIGSNEKAFNIDIKSSTVKSTGNAITIKAGDAADGTVRLKDSTVYSQGSNLPISGNVTVVHNEGDWTNNIFRTNRSDYFQAGVSSAQVFPFGTAKFTEDVCPAEIWVNGAKVNTVTTWNALQTDVQSRLASNDVTVKLTGDARLAYGFSEWKTIGVAGHTLTIESENANDRATIYVYATHHAFYPAGNVVFKNVNLYQNTSNSLFNLSANTKLVTLENVDITVGNIVRYGTIIGSGTNMGSTTEQAKLNFINVNYSKVNGATYYETYMVRIANSGETNKYYLDITLDGCNVDYTGAKGGLITAGTYEKASVARNLNLIVKNSKIKSVGADAIDNADYITAIKLDAKSTFTYTNNLAKPIDNDGSNFAVLQEGGQKISVVVGDTKTTYTNWNAAVTAANAATEDATILLESDVIIEYNGGNWNSSGAGGVELKNANGKKITVDGQNKYGINALNSGNTIYMGGDIEFKNMTIADSVVGSLFDMRQQANLTLTNVDFYGAGTHEYTVICTLYESNVPFNVTLNNVTAQGYSGSKNNNQISFIRTGNPGMANFVNITMFNCDIDMSACPNADVIAVTNATTANITLVSTELKNPEGTGKAINVGTANTNAAPEGFGTATKITNVGSTFTSVTTGVATDTVDKEDVTPKMKDGASVRINTEELTQNGIRFTSVFTSDVLAAIEAIADNAEFKYGTLITITDAVKANGGKFNPSAIRKLGYTVADVAATEGVTIDAATGDVTVRAALINLKDNTRKYSAVAYVEFTVNGNVCRIYSDYNEADNSRSMAQIAQAALNDVKKPGDAGYDSKVHIYNCGAGFSPYTAAQRAVLESYLD